MSKPSPARYPTTNWSVYNAALRNRGSGNGGRDITPEAGRGEDALHRGVRERISARDPTRQTAEIHIGIAFKNRFSALGTAKIVRVS